MFIYVGVAQQNLYPFVGLRGLNDEQSGGDGVGKSRRQKKKKKKIGVDSMTSILYYLALRYIIPKRCFVVGLYYTFSSSLSFSLEKTSELSL